MKKEEFKTLYLDSNSQEFNKALKDIIKEFCELEIDELNKQRIKFIDKLIEKSKDLEPSMLSYSSITAMTFNFEDRNDQLSEIGPFLRAALNEHFEEKVHEEHIDEEGDLANQYKVVKKSIEHLDLAINQKQSLYNEQRIELFKIKGVIVSFNQKIKNTESKIKNTESKIKNTESKIKNTESKIKDTESKIKDTESKIEKADSKINEIDEIKNKIYTDFVAILGIFASIIFGVFGGFQEIQLIGKNLNTTPIPKLLIFSSLVMLGITLIIFLCFNAISKLTNKPLRSCNCKAGECNCSFRKRHPTIFYSSCIYLYVLLVGFALRLYKYNDFTFSNIFKSKSNHFEILPLMLLLTPIWLLILILIGKRGVNFYNKKRISKVKNPS
ncbi:hypothetical protein [Staphylococcus hominis]|uniref:hypothetical protein n=1 Tax=Staphylococcus hominis TaxID=1290 RepID=UPI0028781A4C|nr:hypothetical protein [Staphylococcus hominis]MDS3925256.1 hypothetical protein [Staphylococcus hominis]